MPTKHKIGDKLILIGITDAGNKIFDDKIEIKKTRNYVEELYTQLLKTDPGQYLNFNIIQIQVTDFNFIKDKIKYSGKILVGQPEEIGSLCETSFFDGPKRVETCNYIWAIPDGKEFYEIDYGRYTKYIDYDYIRMILMPKVNKDIQAKNFINFVDDILYQNRKKL